MGLRSSRQLPPAACSPELPGFADHIQTASGSRLEPASLGSLSAGASSPGKGCRPSHGPTRRPVPMRRCPAQRPRCGDVPSSSPALSKAWTEVRSQYCLLHPEGCAFFFFLEASFPPAPFTSREKHPQNTTVLLPGSQGTAVGVWRRLGEKKKAHTLLLALSIPQPTHTNGQHHRLHFIRQRTQESTLTQERAGPRRRRAPPAHTQRPSRGERFWSILSNKSPPWEPREDWKY